MEKVTYVWKIKLSRPWTLIEFRHDEPQALRNGFSGHLKWPVAQYKTMESLTEPARPRFGGLKKYLKHVACNAVTFINKRYFILLEITATVRAGLFYFLLKI